MIAGCSLVLVACCLLVFICCGMWVARCVLFVACWLFGVVRYVQLSVWRLLVVACC